MIVSARCLFSCIWCLDGRTQNEMCKCRIPTKTNVLLHLFQDLHHALVDVLVVAQSMVERASPSGTQR